MFSHYFAWIDHHPRFYLYVALTIVFTCPIAVALEAGWNNKKVDVGAVAGAAIVGGLVGAFWPAALLLAGGILAAGVLIGVLALLSFGVARIGKGARYLSQYKTRPKKPAAPKPSPSEPPVPAPYRSPRCGECNRPYGDAP